MFKVSKKNDNNNNNKKKKPERHNLSGSGVFIVNFEHISHFSLVFLVLTLSK